MLTSKQDKIHEDRSHRRAGTEPSSSGLAIVEARAIIEAEERPFNRQKKRHGQDPRDQHLEVDQSCVIFHQQRLDNFFNKKRP
jgi:hypothetical protein